MTLVPDGVDCGAGGELPLDAAPSRLNPPVQRWIGYARSRSCCPLPRLPVLTDVVVVPVLVPYLLTLYLVTWLL